MTDELKVFIVTLRLAGHQVVRTSAHATRCDLCNTRWYGWPLPVSQCVPKSTATTGSITADQIATGSITADKIAGDKL